jgi:hypothetical protein
MDGDIGGRGHGDGAGTGSRHGGAGLLGNVEAHGVVLGFLESGRSLRVHCDFSILLV